HAIDSTARETPTTMHDVHVTGAARIDPASPGADIKPERWALRAPKLARMDRLCALALVAADGALLDAGLDPAGWNGDRVAIVVECGDPARGRGARLLGQLAGAATLHRSLARDALLAAATVAATEGGLASPPPSIDAPEGDDAVAPLAALADSFRSDGNRL